MDNQSQRFFDLLACWFYGIVQNNLVFCSNYMNCDLPIMRLIEMSSPAHIIMISFKLAGYNGNRDLFHMSILNRFRHFGMMCVFSLSLLLLCTSALMATDKPAEQRRVAFTVLTTSEDLPPLADFYCEISGDETHIRPGFGRRGSRVIFPMEMNSLTLYRKQILEDGAIEKVVLAEVALPPALSDLHVILLRNPIKHWLVDVHVMDDSVEDFPASSVLFENYYPSEVAIKLADSTFELPIKGRKVVKIPTSGDDLTKVAFIAAVKSDEGWEFRKSGRLAIWPRSRMLIICTPYVQLDKSVVFKVHYLQDIPKAG